MGGGGDAEAPTDLRLFGGGGATAYDNASESTAPAARSLPARAKRRDDADMPSPMLESASLMSLSVLVLDRSDWPVLCVIIVNRAR